MAVNETNVWAINGPVETDARQARELAWIASGGETGIVGPDSLEVKAQATPDGTVMIMPGGFVAQATPNRIDSGYTSAPWQSYLRSIYQSTNVSIAPTDSTGSRSDFVGIEVVDPQFEGTDTSAWTDSDWGSHAFWRTRVIQNVSSDGVMVDGFIGMSRPFVPLARVDIPASTGTITDDMITDLRFLAVERSKNDTILQRPPGDVSINEGDSQNLGVLRTVTVPTWATHVQIDGEINGVRLSGSGDAQGNTRVVVNQDTNVESEPVTWRSGTIGERFDMPVFGRVPIEQSRRGYTLSMWFRILHNSGTATLQISEHLSAMRLRLTFQELPTKS